MNYAEALKKVNATKPKENFMSIRFAYGEKMILPYKDGVAFMASLNNAEMMMEPYNAQHRISPFNKESVISAIVSHDEYVRYKIAALLGVKPEEVTPMEATAQPF